MTPDTATIEPVWMPSSPASIEEDLSRLWKTAARQSPVSRALMSNLVIASGGESSGVDAEDEATYGLSDLACRHPARVVLLDHRGTSHAREPQEVRVGLLTFGPSEHRYGVEVIAVAVACLDESLPSILRAVTRGDVPTTLWMTGDLSVTTPAMPIVEMSRQMVYDSGRWKDLSRGFQGVAGLLRASHHPALVDLAWRRLASMRRAVATALEPLRFNQRPRADQVAVTAGPGRAADAWLLHGWLEIRLGWKSPRPRAIAPSEGIGLAVIFQGDDWRAEIIQSTSNETAAGASAIVVRDTAGRTVTVSPLQESVAEALSDELTSLSYDLTLERVVGSLVN